MSQQTPLIGITTYGLSADDEYHLPRGYVDSVRRAGGYAILIPPGDIRPLAVLARLDGIIMAGGGDICPTRYGGKGHESIYSIDVQRDESELTLVREALSMQIPMLAICRGLQVLNVALGGTLHPHVPDVYGDTELHRAPPRLPVTHTAYLEPGSQLADLMQSGTVECVSWHHQAVDRLANRCRVAARARDGLIEAIELVDRTDVQAVQWHPELSSQRDEQQQRLFDNLVKQAIEFRC